MKSIEVKVGNLLRELGATLAVAESCTGGLIAHRITNVSGSSDYFESAVVSYSNQAKIDMLGVPQSLIDEHGPVSGPVAGKMAEGIREKRKTTIALATTGVAGPLGGTTETPVGTIFIGLAYPNQTIVKQFHFSGKRTELKKLAAEEALKALLKYTAHHEREG